MSEIKGHSNLTKENSILLERVEALENKVREIDEEQINGIKGGLSIRPTIDYLEERIDITERQINNQVDALTKRLNALEIPLKPSDDLEIIVLKAIRDNENITYNKLERLTGLSSATVLKKRDNLKRKGLIRYDKPVRKGRKVHHNITEIDKVSDYIKLNSGESK